MDAQQTLLTLQTSLGPYVQPREAALQMRQVLALQLDGCFEGGSAPRPAFLVDASAHSPLAPASSSSSGGRGDSAPQQQPRGLAREYLRAVAANVAALRAHDAAREAATTGLLHGGGSSSSSNQDVTPPALPPAAAAVDRAADGRLAEQLHLLRLREKRRRVVALRRGVDTLLSKAPAADPDYLEPGAIFADVAPLPAVPREVVEGFSSAGEQDGSGGGGGGGAAGTGVVKADLTELVDRLETAVLRTRLLLRREEGLLAGLKKKEEERKRRREESTTTVSASDDAAAAAAARMHALSTTRNSLIGWIETELGKAGGGGGGGGSEQEEGDEEADESGDDEGGGAPLPGGPAAPTVVDRQRLDEGLAAVRDKYARYVAARRRLVHAAAQTPQLSMRVDAAGNSSSNINNNNSKASAGEDAAWSPQPSGAHLLTPQLEALMAAAHVQRGLIQHKSAFNVALAKQLKETWAGLDRLAAESQLLPSFGPSSSSAARGGRPPGAASKTGGGGGFGMGMGMGDDPGGAGPGMLHNLAMARGAERLDVAAYVAPWVQAAEAAKMATLEAVADRVEDGQVAMEAAAAALGEVDRLLGKGVASGGKAGRAGGEGGDEDEEDLWMGVEAGSRNERLFKKNAEKRREREEARPYDVWETIDGNLCQESRRTK